MDNLRLQILNNRCASGGGRGDAEQYTKTVIGILLADPRQQNVKEYVFNYLDLIDARTGLYFDIYVPGYRLKTDNIDNEDICYRIGAEKDGLILDYSMFVNFIIDIEKTGFKYSLNPMLVLMSVWYNHLADRVEFKDDYYVIQLDKEPGGISQFSRMLDVILDVAKKARPQIGRFKSGVRKYYLKDKVAQDMIGALSAEKLISKVLPAGEKIYNLISPNN